MDRSARVAVGGKAKRGHSAWCPCCQRLSAHRGARCSNCCLGCEQTESGGWDRTQFCPVVRAQAAAALSVSHDRARPLEERPPRLHVEHTPRVPIASLRFL